MASFVPTDPETLEDQRRYTQARLTRVECLDCLAAVGVKKNSEQSFKGILQTCMLSGMNGSVALLGTNQQRTSLQLKDRGEFDTVTCLGVTRLKVTLLGTSSVPEKGRQILSENAGVYSVFGVPVTVKEYPVRSSPSLIPQT